MFLGAVLTAADSELAVLVCDLLWESVVWSVVVLVKGLGSMAAHLVAPIVKGVAPAALALWEPVLAWVFADAL